MTNQTRTLTALGLACSLIATLAVLVFSRGAPDLTTTLDRREVSATAAPAKTILELEAEVPPPRSSEPRTQEERRRGQRTVETPLLSVVALDKSPKSQVFEFSLSIR